MEFIDDETSSLLKVGWIRKHDLLILTAAFLSFLSAGILLWLSLYHNVSYIWPLVVAISSVWLLALLAVMLLYRAIYFTLKVRAIMETMPELAANIAVRKMSKGADSPMEDLTEENLE